MWEVPINQISSNVLGFEINHFSHVNRVLNKLEDISISDDDKIHYLRILIKSMNENSIVFQKDKTQDKTMRRLIKIFVPLAKKLWNNDDCKKWLLKIYNWLEKYLKTVECNVFADRTRDYIEKILTSGTQGWYATAAHRVGGRSFRI